MRKGPAVAASAFALGAVAAPAAAQEPANWTGFYAGADLGILSASHDWHVDDSEIDGGEGGEAGFGVVQESKDFSETVATGAIHVGYMQQLGSVVLGAEGGWGLANVDERHSFDGAEGVNVHSEAHSYGTISGLVGFAAGNLLCFGKGGVAISDLEHTFNDNGVVTDLDPRQEDDGVGWVVGGGVEYLLTPKLSVRLDAEYLKIEDDGKVSGGGETDKFEIETTFATGRIGFNYRF